MKHSLFIILFLALTSTVVAQPLFKVITVSDGVTIAGNAVTPGMVVEKSTEMLIIPDGGYVSFITNDGLLETMRHSVQISNLKKTLLSERGAIFDDRPVFFPVTHSNQTSEIIGDSIFVFWNYPRPSDMPSPPRNFVITNVYDEVLRTIPEPDSHWLLLDISEFRKKEEIIVLAVHGKKKRDATEYNSVKLKATKTREMIDAQLAPFKNDDDKLFYEFVIYTLNDLYHDRSIPFYKIVSKKPSAKDPFLKTYFDLQLKVTPLRLVNLN